MAEVTQDMTLGQALDLAQTRATEANEKNAAKNVGQLKNAISKGILSRNVLSMLNVLLVGFPLFLSIASFTSGRVRRWSKASFTVKLLSFTFATKSACFIY